MKISVNNPAVEHFIKQQVTSGHFTSPDEVVEASLSLMMSAPDDEPLDAETIAAIDRAEAQYTRGEGIPASEAFERIRREHFGG